VDETAGESECLVAMPYEFSPLPAKTAAVDLMDRGGVVLCAGMVERVVPGKKPAGTPVVWVRAPKEHSMVVRSLRLRKEGV
jgi:hypothetical protein